MALKQKFKAALKKVLRMILPWVVANPKLKAVAKKVAFKLGIAHRLNSFVRRLLLFHQQPTHHPTNQQALTPRARHIYHDLNQAIEKRLKGEA